VPDNPTQPGQLPRQQFAASNDATRNQSRMARLEERVKQLEQGKQLIQTPMFTWTSEVTVSSVTSKTWTFTIPMPPAVRDPGSLVKLEYMFCWFEVPILSVGGAVSGNVSISTAATSASWSWSIASGGVQTYLYPNTASGTAATQADRSTFIPFRLAADSPSGAIIDTSLVVTRTSASNSFTLGYPALGIWPRFYAIIPPSFASTTS
jgi:hypothetical protein